MVNISSMSNIELKLNLKLTLYTVSLQYDNRFFSSARSKFCQADLTDALFENNATQ